MIFLISTFRNWALCLCSPTLLGRILLICRRCVPVIVFVEQNLVTVHCIHIEGVPQLGVQILVTLFIVVTAFLFFDLFHFLVQVLNLVHHLLGL